MLSDLRLAIRQLTKTPGFTIVAVLTLTLGIGVCTAMFSVVNTVLLKPLPFQEPESLVWIENIGKTGLSGRTSRADVVAQWQLQNKSFESIAGYFAFFDYRSTTVTGSGESERLRAVPVTDNFLPTLGVPLLHGRNFSKEESASLSSPATVILGYDFWQRKFHGSPEVLGSSLNLNGRPTTVIGVVSPNFDFDSIFSPGTEVQMLVPFPLNEETARSGNTLFAIGRLKPATTIDDARAEFEVLTPHVLETLKRRDVTGFKMQLMNDYLRHPFRSAFNILMVAVGCVLAIACVNLSSLLLGRINSRRQEFAVRTALGASRWHLIRQTMTESLLLSFCGSGIGILLAMWATDLLSQLDTFGVPLLANASVDTSALIVTIGITIIAGIGCGILPALHLSQKQQSTLQTATQQRSAGRSSTMVRNTLVIVEVALACMLLVGAGLLIRSFGQLLKVDLGFQPREAIAWRIDATQPFEDNQQGIQYYDRLAQRVAALPGVESVGISDSLPLGRNRSWGISVPGAPDGTGRSNAFPRLVSHGYLHAMQIPLIAGRYFDERDGAEAAQTVIISRSLAQRLFDQEDPIGRIVNSIGRELTVIGVVGDVRHASLEKVGGNEMYLDLRQLFWSSGLELVVRSTRSAASLVPDVRQALFEHDPMLPNSQYRQLDVLIENAVAPRRLITRMLGGFSILALGLASLGLYGVIAFSVTQRTQEIGIRMALGAQRNDVLQMILRGGLRLVLIGIVIGLTGAFALTKTLQSLLYGISAHDPLVFLGNAALLLIVATLACLIPARRATKVDPMVALRTE